MLPSVSVITICLNDPDGVRLTIESVQRQDYPSLQYVVIDGQSRDETLAVYASYRDAIDVFVCEPDRGIYDAMNKGLRASTGEWYIMMNAGDVFASANAIRENMSLIMAGGGNWGGGGSCIRFADGSERTYFSDADTCVFHQQSIFIRRAIHEQYGYFIVDRASNAWDYFFFQLIRNEPFVKTDMLVSICDGTGVSLSVPNYLHAHVIAFLFGRESRIKTATILLLYPVYRRISSFRSLFRKRGSNDGP
jgi:glycosyltransferase involved in cell wall biosynthesis